MVKWSVLAGLIAGIIFFLAYHGIVHSSQLGRYDVRMRLQAGRGDSMLSGDSEPAWASTIRLRLFNLNLNAESSPLPNGGLELNMFYVKDTSAVRRSLAPSERVEIRPLYNLGELPGFFKAAEEAVQRLYPQENMSIYSLISPTIPREKGNQSIYPAAIGAVSKKDVRRLMQVLHDSVFAAALPRDLELRLGILTEDARIRNTPDDLMVFATRNPGEDGVISNEDLAAAMGYGNEQADGQRVMLHFNENGRQKWEEITNENVGEKLSILLGDTVISTPAVTGPMRTGQVTIHTHLPGEALLRFCDQVNRGDLPADLKMTMLEINPSRPTGGLTRWIVSLVAALATATLVLVIFKSLKNRNR